MERKEKQPLSFRVFPFWYGWVWRSSSCLFLLLTQLPLQKKKKKTVYAFVAADHLWECISTRAHKRAVARGDRDPPKISSLFPPLSESVTGSLDPVFRFSLFAISLLLTLRLGRVYDR